MTLRKFINREEAGIQLAGKLEKYRNEPCIILAVPRGGVPVAYSIAKKLELPAELILAKKIGYPGNKEYAIGAATLTDYFVIPHKNVSQEYIINEVQRIRTRLMDMQTKFNTSPDPGKLVGKTVIIVDDGIATGNTLLTTVKLLRKSNPVKIVVAVPVASPEAVKKLSEIADDVVVVFKPSQFFGVGAFYEDFAQVSDEEVLCFLHKLKKAGKAD